MAKYTEIQKIYHKFFKACETVRESVSDMRLRQCVNNNCEESDLPSIDNIYIIGKYEDKYWLFEEDAFYCASYLKKPILYANGFMYIELQQQDVDDLLKMISGNQYVIIAPM